MSKFKQGDKVVISPECEHEQYRGISGTVLDVSPIPHSDGLKNRVGLDKPVNHACVFWFRDDELLQDDVLQGPIPMSNEQIMRLMGES